MSARGRRFAIGISVAAAVLAVCLANAHLVYVAMDSQPECMPHAHPGEAAAGYGAAQPSC